jgi:DNA-binding CsgD family transcriptional regulator/catechol 2,3-dioxygenase-like lactoylglutathione lyase family enzyme
MVRRAWGRENRPSGGYHSSDMRDRRPRGRPPHGDVLTPAEWRIVNAVRHGLGNAEIARRRGVSVDAVKYHVGNAIAKLGLPDRRALRNWRGVPADSPLRPDNTRKDATMTVTATMTPGSLGPIGQISRTVKDIAQAEEWYGKVLGFKHLYTFGKLAFFDCGGTRLYLTQEESPGVESILYFRVPDIHAAHTELAARGVRFLGAPHLIFKHPDDTEEWMAFFNDPEGRPLALMSQIKR